MSPDFFRCFIEKEDSTKPQFVHAIAPKKAATWQAGKAGYKPLGDIVESTSSRPLKYD